MKATYTLLSLWLLIALFFQGCASYTPSQPVYYPPPRPVEPQQPAPDLETKPVLPVPKPTSSVATSFSKQATEQINQGRLDLAAATLERGLRVAPKDASLWSHLAEIKLQQKSYQQAESLAAKSNSLAGSNMSVIQKNQRIIEEARKSTQNQ